VLPWFGVSIGMHAFPFVALVFVANVLRVIWFDAIYGFAIGVLVPAWILGVR
jgi:hypothetical protein